MCACVRVCVCVRVRVCVTINLLYAGMAGKDDLADAVLGGASDYMHDIFMKIAKWYEAKDKQEKVYCYCNHKCLS